jgi:hypothetical protein
MLRINKLLKIPKDFILWNFSWKFQKISFFDFDFKNFNISTKNTISVEAPNVLQYTQRKYILSR